MLDGLHPHGAGCAEIPVVGEHPPEQHRIIGVQHQLQRRVAAIAVGGRQVRPQPVADGVERGGGPGPFLLERLQPAFGAVARAARGLEALAGRFQGFVGRPQRRGRLIPGRRLGVDRLGDLADPGLDPGELGTGVRLVRGTRQSRDEQGDQGGGWERAARRHGGQWIPGT